MRSWTTQWVYNLLIHVSFVRLFIHLLCTLRLVRPKLKAISEVWISLQGFCSLPLWKNAVLLGATQHCKQYNHELLCVSSLGPCTKPLLLFTIPTKPSLPLWHPCWCLTVMGTITQKVLNKAKLRYYVGGVHPFYLWTGRTYEILMTSCFPNSSGVNVLFRWMYTVSIDRAGTFCWPLLNRAACWNVHHAAVIAANDSNV